MLSSKLISFHVVSVFLLAVVKFSISQDVKPIIRVLAPQFICAPDKSNGTTGIIASPGVTNIGIHSKSGGELSLNWTVRYKSLTGPKGQRTNIILWRIVRQLEKTLNGMSSQILETNNVAINNSLLVEGVQYNFKVFGVSESGVAGDEDSFSIKYSDSKQDPTLELKDLQVLEQFSILILGSETTYSDTPYSLEASVIACKPTNDYYFEWRVKDLKTKSDLKLGKQMGRKLVIPQGKLVGGRSYEITCRVLHSTAKRLIIRSEYFLTVLKKGLSLDMSCENITVTINSPISITATLSDRDNIPAPPLFEWICRKDDMNDCDDFASSNTPELNMEGGFGEEGIYQIHVKVTKGNNNVENACEINVKSSVLPLIDIESNKKVIPSNKPLEIQSQVSDLRSGCTLQWLLLHEEGLGYFDVSLLPNTFGRKLSINSFDETFLSEIVEFGNGTFTRNYPLIIPAAFGSWPGLESEMSYRFRLFVHCICTESIECDGPSDVTAYSDITVRTNGPPILEAVTVKPPLGTALQTVFTFSTRPANDAPTDHPLWYMFGIKMPANEILYINHYMDHTVMETVLPPSVTPIIPVLTVCDNRGACSTAEGNGVLVDVPKTLTESDVELLKGRFTANMYRLEYKDAFYYAMVVLQTLEAMDLNGTYENFLMFVETKTRSNIAALIEDPKDIDTFSANNLVHEATFYIQKYSMFSEEFLQDILKLRDILFELVSENSAQLVGEMSVRKKRSYQLERYLRQKRDVTLEDLKNYLKISESTMKGEAWNEEKKKMLNKIVKSTPDLCRKSSKYSNSIDSQITSLSFEKIQLRPNMPIVYVPYLPHIGGNMDLSNVANMQFVSSDKLNGKTYCMAKYAFTIDILSDSIDENQRGPIYYGSLYSDDLTGLYKASADVYPILLQIPIQKDTELYECRRWSQNSWLQGTCETNPKYETINTRQYVVCKCDNLGYVSLYIIQNNEQVTEEIIYPEIVTTDIYITETSTNTDATTSTTQTTVVQPTIVERTTLQSNIVVPSIESIICSGDNCNKYSQTGIIFGVISVIILLCIALGVFVLLRRRNRKKVNTENKVKLMRKSVIKNELKYRKFYAEHLMEGSTESLAKYNILQDNDGSEDD